MGCAPTMHGFWMMTSRQSRSHFDGEGNSQTTHGPIVVEYVMTLMQRHRALAIVRHRLYTYNNISDYVEVRRRNWSLSFMITMRHYDAHMTPPNISDRKTLTVYGSTPAKTESALHDIHQEKGHAPSVQFDPAHPVSQTQRYCRYPFWQ